MINLKIFFLFSLVIFIPSVYAIGISPAMLEVNFEPNLVETYEFTVFGENIEPYVKYDTAELNNTITITDLRKAGDRVYFKVTLKLPAKIEQPGTHTILIGAKETSGSSDMLSARINVQTPIYVIVPYPGKYLEISLDAPDIKTNEIANFIIHCSNLGEESATVKGKIEIYDKNNLIDGLMTEEKAISRKEKTDFVLSWNSAGQKEGEYNAKAIVNYDGKTAESEKIFRIGTLRIDILNYTKTVNAKDRNNFKIEVKSMWNEKITNVFGEIKIFNESRLIDSFKTITSDIEPWQQQNMTAWWDTENIAPGIYDANITIFYSGKSSSVLGEINVAQKSSANLSSASIITGVVILIIAVNLIIWLIISRRPKQKKKTKRS